MRVTERSEDIPFFKKSLIRAKVVTVGFNTHNSIWKDWKEPTEKGYAKIMEYDEENWKLRRFEKNEGEVEAITQLFKDNIMALFNVYIELAASSNFPEIKWLTFTEYFGQYQGWDEKKEMVLIDEGTIDRIFKGVISDYKSDGILRYHFWEAIVRFAIAKYKDTGLATSSFDAVKKCLEEDIFSKPGSKTSWIDFRNNILYQEEVNAEFACNLK